MTAGKKVLIVIGCFLLLKLMTDYAENARRNELRLQNQRELQVQRELREQQELREQRRLLRVQEQRKLRSQSVNDRDDVMEDPRFKALFNQWKQIHGR